MKEVEKQKFPWDSLAILVVILVVLWVIVMFN